MVISEEIRDSIRREGFLEIGNTVAARVLNEIGFSAFYRQRIWPLLPPVSEHGLRNGIKVHGEPRRLFDAFLPFYTPGFIRDFKQPNLEQIFRLVETGDKVGIIGAGFGVSTVAAAIATGPSGCVIAYDADRNRVEITRETVELNECEAPIDINNCVIGEHFGELETQDENRISPSELPDVDVLEMDCEGAELLILDELDIKPRAIIVELHHKKQFSPYDDPVEIVEQLRELGYETEYYDGPWVDGIIVGHI